MSNGFLKGAKTIAKALGRNERTVRRMVENGRLRGFKPNGKNSPITVARKEIARVRRELVSDEA